MKRAKNFNIPASVDFLYPEEEPEKDETETGPIDLITVSLASQQLPDPRAVLAALSIVLEAFCEWGFRGDCWRIVLGRNPDSMAAIARRWGVSRNGVWSVCKTMRRKLSAHYHPPKLGRYAHPEGSFINNQKD